MKQLYKILCLIWSFPHPPAPLPSGKGGTLRLFYARGFAPCIPGAESGRHLQNLPSRCPAKECLRLGARATEMLSFGQCRQPRRGGTGGEELRRLRWSSPPHHKARARGDVVGDAGAGERRGGFLKKSP